MPTVYQAYRFALDPTPRQQGMLASHVGAARYAFNWGLAHVKQLLDKHQTDPSVRVPWTLRALRREWNQVKDQVAPWWRENSKEAYNSGLDALARALQNFTDSRAGRRKGKRMGFPKFRRKHTTRDACRFTTGPIRVEPDLHHVVLPRLGRIRTHESTRKLACRLEQGTARVLAATVSCVGGRWHVILTCEVQRNQRAPRRPAAVVGVDVGIRHLAVLSTGEVIPNPASLAGGLRRLRRLNRQLARREGPRTCDGARVPSAGWRQTKARLARAHAQVANVRRDGMHKLTSALASEYGSIVVENLNVAGMLRNRRLARRIADASLGRLRRQLGYKSAWAGRLFVVADTFYPSSKTCSGCGHVKAKLSLSERVFHCEACGLIIDRDFNAAINLAKLVEAVAGSGPGTLTARGGDVRPGLAGRSPVKREASAGPACLGETGAVGP